MPPRIITNAYAFSHRERAFQRWKDKGKFILLARKWKKRNGFLII